MSEPTTIHFCPNCACDLTKFRILKNRPGQGRPAFIIPTEAKAEYESGTMTLAELALKHDCSSSKMHQWLSQNGAKKPKLSSMLPASLREEYETGATVMALASRYKSHPSAVTERLLHLGTKMRSRGNGTEKPKERALEMIRRLKAGETLAAIGVDHGITRERVRQIIMAHGGPAARKLKEGPTLARSKAREHAARKRAKEKIDALMQFSAEYQNGDLYKVMAERRGCTERKIAKKIAYFRQTHPELFPMRRNHTLDPRTMP